MTSGLRLKATTHQQRSRQWMDRFVCQATLNAGFTTPTCFKALNSCCSCASLGQVTRPWAATVMAHLGDQRQNNFSSL